MKPIWHLTKTLYTQVLQIGHGLDAGWEVMHPVGAGKGVITVTNGPSATAPPMIADMLKVRGVWRVIAEQAPEDRGGDYFIITADKPREWSEIRAEIEAALARHLE